MEDVRPYRIEEEKNEREEERPDLEAVQRDEEVPFHIPRD